MKRICAITMVRNDDFFLQKWVEYYGREIGRDNLYIFFDGTDQVIPDFCNGAHTELVEKIGTNVVSSDKGRIRFLSAKASALFAEGYDIVIGTDADEYITPDPKTGQTLSQYLNTHAIGVALSALGLDFGQRLGDEGDLSLDRPFLSQRSYAQLGSRYTKASIVAKPCVWGSGFHRVKCHNFNIGSDLYLLHFGYSDKRLIESRFNDADRLSQGWKKHMHKRSRTIRYVTNKKARNFDRWVLRARVCQTYVRPFYAWNKPAMLGMRIVVKLPERFRNVL
ncbi:MAG: glycosyltransferase family 2 protein [Muribaculaceae bacterium]|nr:glycosyltransferase family 2 protein [Muribaculaceae bacterium]